MINVTALTKRYGDRLAVDDLTFDLADGRVTGFVGPNGAGKSTTMKLMVDLSRPDGGEVRYDGVAYRDLEHPARVVGSVLDARCMHPGRSARNHLRGFAEAGGTVFVSSHLIAELARFADDLVVVGAGRLITSEPVESLTARTGMSLEDSLLEMTTASAEFASA